MHRRRFINSMAAGAALALNASVVANDLFEPSRGDFPEETGEKSDFDELTRQLLVVWCDGMLNRQIHLPEDQRLHGALACPACDRIHGRCSDALYPFLHLAHTTGDTKYLTAAINVYNWAENNVSDEDGSWRNDIAPKAWRGTTIFGAIALAEALHYHGEVLPNNLEAAWKQRLDRAAGGYLFRDFKSIDFTNVNYGMTGIYGFHLFGRVLKNQKYSDRSQQLAERVKEFFTKPNALIWGEGKPNDNRSGRGLLPIDLGYNVEESLNGLALFALDVNDDELMKLVSKSMNGHLEFMLPDGAWDNSWGTRSQKWSYWGSRTSDGCQPAYCFMAGQNPSFGTAALKNAELLKRCTADGLLHGGPHYVSHGVKPCIHHTFTHAKVMALVQDRMHNNLHATPKFDASKPLPRQIANGVKHFPELDVWLVAKGPWRGTVSAYDSIYKTKNADHLQQPTGGALAVLYHEKVGTLLAGSMAKYVMVEPLNMQSQPGEDFPLTIRVETRKHDVWYSNLYELKAHVNFTEDRDVISFDIVTRLLDEDRQPVGGIRKHPMQYKLGYQFHQDRITLTAKRVAKFESPEIADFVLPIISSSVEKLRRVSSHRVEIDKPGGTVVIESSEPLKIKESPKGRVFNMVPGFEAIPIFIRLPQDDESSAMCTVSVV